MRKKKSKRNKSHNAGTCPSTLSVITHTVACSMEIYCLHVHPHASCRFLPLGNNVCAASCYNFSWDAPHQLQASTQHLSRALNYYWMNTDTLCLMLMQQHSYNPNINTHQHAGPRGPVVPLHLTRLLKSGHIVMLKADQCVCTATNYSLSCWAHEPNRYYPIVT